MHQYQQLSARIYAIQSVQSEENIMFWYIICTLCIHSQQLSDSKIKNQKTKTEEKTKRQRIKRNKCGRATIRSPIHKMTTETISRPLILLYLDVLLNEETQNCLPFLFNRTEDSIPTNTKAIKY